MISSRNFSAGQWWHIPLISALYMILRTAWYIECVLGQLVLLHKKDPSHKRGKNRHISRKLLTFPFSNLWAHLIKVHVKQY